MSVSDYQVIIETIGNTRTETGLTVTAVMDTNDYPTGVKISDTQMKTIPITRHQFHGEWNYCIHSGPKEIPLQRNQISTKRAH